MVELAGKLEEIQCGFGKLLEHCDDLDRSPVDDLQARSDLQQMISPLLRKTYEAKISAVASLEPDLLCGWYPFNTAGIMIFMGRIESLLEGLLELSFSSYGVATGAMGTVYVDLIAVGLSPAVPAAGTQPTVRTEKASYGPFEPIVFIFTNADGVSNDDWIGFMATGAPHSAYIDPGFIYLRHVKDGSVTFEAGLPEGTYDVRLYWDDSYTLEASNVFIVE